MVKSEICRYKRSIGLQPLPDNNAADISINKRGATAFETLPMSQNAIYDLIFAGRSTSPSLILNVMKPLVGYVKSGVSLDEQSISLLGAEPCMIFLTIVLKNSRKV